VKTKLAKAFPTASNPVPLSRLLLALNMLLSSSEVYWCMGSLRERCIEAKHPPPWGRSSSARMFSVLLELGTVPTTNDAANRDQRRESRRDKGSSPPAREKPSVSLFAAGQLVLMHGAVRRVWRSYANPCSQGTFSSVLHM
jgi:hypothetical protein